MVQHLRLQGLMRLGLSGLLFLAPATAGAQVATALRLDLQGFLTANELTPADIDYAATVLAGSHSGNWANGYSGGGADAKMLSVKPVKAGTTPISYSFKAVYDGAPRLTPRLYTCKPSGACAEAETTHADGKMLAAIGDTQWEVRASGPTCASGLTCEVVIPSWALERRRTTNDGGMQPFPPVATLVGHKRGVTIFNAETGKEWLTIFVDKRLHTFTGATLSGALLVLDFTEGRCVLDFSSDRAFTIMGGSVTMANTGIGALADAEWKEIAAKIGSSHAKLLAVTNRLLVWDDVFAKFSPKARTSDTVVEEFRDTPAIFSEVYSVDDGGLALVATGGSGGGPAGPWMYDARTKEWGPVTTEALTAAAASGKVLDPSKLAQSSLLRHGRSLIRDEKGEVCRWKIMEPGDSDGNAAAKWSGMDAPCDTMSVVLTTDRSMSISTVKDAAVLVSLQRQ